MFLKICTRNGCYKMWLNLNWIFLIFCLIFAVEKSMLCWGDIHRHMSLWKSTTEAADRMCVPLWGCKTSQTHLCANMVSVCYITYMYLVIGTFVHSLLRQFAVCLSCYDDYSLDGHQHSATATVWAQISQNPWVAKLRR